MTQDLQTVLKRLELPRQRFHDVRHAYATLMIEGGGELAVVSRSLGHSTISTISTISTTADVYSHLMAPERVEGASG